MFGGLFSGKKKEATAPDKPMEISAPTGFQRGIHIDHNKDDGTFSGVPSEWQAHLPTPVQYVVDTSGLPAHLKPTSQPKGASDGGISAPYNFQHIDHVKVNPTASSGFEGLPSGWDDLLKRSGISKD